MKTITRTEAGKVDKIYRDMLKTEKHHNHEIIMDDHGTLRWKENTHVNKIRERISLNDLCPLLCCMGYDKNSEVYRKLYRDIGYSLFGYWEIFYWDANNDEADEYVPNPSCVPQNDRTKKSYNIVFYILLAMTATALVVGIILENTQP